MYKKNRFLLSCSIKPHLQLSLDDLHVILSTWRHIDGLGAFSFLILFPQSFNISLEHMYSWDIWPTLDMFGHCNSLYFDLTVAFSSFYLSHVCCQVDNFCSNYLLLYVSFSPDCGYVMLSLIIWSLRFLFLAHLSFGF